MNTGKDLKKIESVNFFQKEGGSTFLKSLFKVKRGFRMCFFRTRMCFVKFWEQQKKFWDTNLFFWKFLIGLHFKGGQFANLEKAFWISIFWDPSLIKGASSSTFQQKLKILWEIMDKGSSQSRCYQALLCSAHERKKCRPCSGHGREPGTLQSAHEGEGPKSSWNCHFCIFANLNILRESTFKKISLWTRRLFKNPGGVP